MIRIDDRRTGKIQIIDIPLVDGLITIYADVGDRIAYGDARTIELCGEKDLKSKLDELRKEKKKEYMRNYQRERRKNNGT